MWVEGRGGTERAEGGEVEEREVVEGGGGTGVGVGVSGGDEEVEDQAGEERGGAGRYGLEGAGCVKFGYSLMRALVIGLKETYCVLVSGAWPCFLLYILRAILACTCWICCVVVLPTTHYILNFVLANDLKKADRQPGLRDDRTPQRRATSPLCPLTITITI